ncbi:hypothetical protein [Mesorhizobium sp.]|uniref:hypothetical protein n=1 Tax=Mesorhizobium sp. TaxID=1871066 RepID=UPI00345C144B
MIAELEFPIERRGKLVVHRQIVVERRDVFERTGDRLAEIIIEGRCELRLRIDLRRRYSACRGRGGEMMVLDIVEHEVLVERRRKLVVKRVAGRGFESRLFRLRDGFALLRAELAHQFLLEVDVEIALRGRLIGGRSLLDRRLRLYRLARVETHDPGQFRKRIVVSDVVAIGYFQLGSVCHYCSRTRTQSDAMDVAQGWPLPAQCGQKVTGFLVKPNASRWAHPPLSASGRTSKRPKQPAPALVWHTSIVGR